MRTVLKYRMYSRLGIFLRVLLIQKTHHTGTVHSGFWIFNTEGIHLREKFVENFSVQIAVVQYIVCTIYSTRFRVNESE